jgi:hypothetical protein
VSLARAGNPAAALKEAEAMLRSSRDGASLYGVAGVYARVSQALRSGGNNPPAGRRDDAEQYASRAVALLREAYEVLSAAGKLTREEWLHNADLAPLRERADFQALLRDLLFPPDPFVSSG